MGRQLPLLSALVLNAASLPAFADEPIATDRPDFVESSATVGAHTWQIETSVAWEKDDAMRAYTTPTLLRYGIGDRWELRLETDGYTRLSGDGPDHNGMADVAIGVKHALREADGAIPAMAILLHLDLPTGSNGLAGHGSRPSVRIVGEWEIGERWAAGVMPGLIREDDGTGHDYTAGIFGAVLGYSWTDVSRSFVELALPHIASDRNGGTPAQLNLGAAWLLSNDAQLDVVYSHGLNNEAPDNGVGLGFSFRF